MRQYFTESFKVVFRRNQKQSGSNRNHQEASGRFRKHQTRQGDQPGLGGQALQGEQTRQGDQAGQGDQAVQGDQPALLQGGIAIRIMPK